MRIMPVTSKYAIQMDGSFIGGGTARMRAERLEWDNLLFSEVE